MANVWIRLCIFVSIREGVHYAVSINGHLVIYGDQQGPDFPAMHLPSRSTRVPDHLCILKVVVR